MLWYSRNMAVAKPKKPGDGSLPNHGESISKGNALLPGMDDEDLQRMRAELSGLKEVRREALIIAAAIKRREGLSVSEAARQLLQLRPTYMTGWCGCGPDGA